MRNVLWVLGWTLLATQVCDVAADRRTAGRGLRLRRRRWLWATALFGSRER